MSKEINDLNKPLKDQLDLDKKQDKTDNNLVTADKTIVGAINELFQNANNGKQLIANAIGEPLSSNDTFSAMSTDINSLLSTFKTNMMNNGVAVNSSDRFKSLIDKIATLADNEGKGIQFAEFTTSVSFELNYTNPKYLNINGDYNFKPTHIILNFTERTSGTPSHHQVITLNTFPGAATTFFSGSSGLSVRIESTEIGSVKLWYNGKGTSSISSYRGYDVHCYLFGVGEEDTTLRDSLASILQDEGVSVTDNDDMASLIAKADSEFNEKNTEINSLTSELAGKVTPAGTAVAANVLSGKTFINSTGQTVTGNMPTRGGGTVTPTTTNQTLPTGHYSSEIIIAGDADLIAANIVSGKNIFGVNGTAATAKRVSTGTLSTISANNKTTSVQSTTVTTNLGFTPSRIILNCTCTITSLTIKNVSIDSNYCNSASNYFGTTKGNIIYVYITNITSSSFVVSMKKNDSQLSPVTLTDITWTAYE